MKALIYRPARTAAQSGRAGTRRWVLEPEADSPPTVDSPMGWTGSSDAGSQVRLYFDAVEVAAVHTRAGGLDCEVTAPRESRAPVKPCADNFRYHRVERTRP